MTNRETVLRELAELRDRLLDTIGNDYARDVENIMAMLSDEPSARLTEATFQAKEGEPLQATAQFQGDAVKEWALVMVQWFREKGGINYVACDLRDPTTGEAYEIVMQKAGGRTPAQDLAEMRAQLNRGAEP